jgi:recombination protein RecA
MIFINQIRQKIGVMFGNPETTSGGLALKFYASVRLEIRKMTGVKDGDETVGSRVKAKVVKNKVAPPFRQCEFDLMFDRGISWEGDLLDLALEDRLIEKSGAFLTIGEVKLQGREKAKEYLREHPGAADELRRQILTKRGLLPASEEHPAANDGSVESGPKRRGRQPATAE